MLVMVDFLHYFIKITLDKIHLLCLCFYAIKFTEDFTTTYIFIIITCAKKPPKQQRLQVHLETEHPYQAFSELPKLHLKSSGISLISTVSCNDTLHCHEIS